MRLIDADELLRRYDEEHEGPPGRARKLIEEAQTVGGLFSIKEVARIIADLFGDKCACNNNDIDEWLPKYCKYRDTDCPYPPGASCWEQYLKHLSEKPVEVKND
jgi:hypothetical protein